MSENGLTNVSVLSRPMCLYIDSSLVWSTTVQLSHNQYRIESKRLCNVRTKFRILMSALKVLRKRSVATAPSVMPVLCISPLQNSLAGRAAISIDTPALPCCAKGMRRPAAGGIPRSVNRLDGHCACTGEVSSGWVLVQPVGKLSRQFASKVMTKNQPLSNGMSG